MTQTTVTGVNMLRRWMVEGTCWELQQMTAFGISDTGCLFSAALLIIFNCTQNSGEW